MKFCDERDVAFRFRCRLPQQLLNHVAMIEINVISIFFFGLPFWIFETNRRHLVVSVLRLAGHAIFYNVTISGTVWICQDSWLQAW